MTSSDGRVNWWGLSAVTLAHALALAGLATYTPSTRALPRIAPIVVELLPPHAPTRWQAGRKAAPATKIKRAVAPDLPTPVAEAVKPPIVPQAEAAPTRGPAPDSAAISRADPEPRLARQVIPPATSTAQSPAYPLASEAIAYLENPAPAYPSMARRLREQGKVIVRVLVNPTGTADRIELRASSGSQRLDGAALETVRRWCFIPARQGSQAVSSWVLVPISFSLEG